MKSYIFALRFIIASLLYLLLNYIIDFDYLLSFNCFSLLLLASLALLIFYHIILKKKSRIVCIIIDFAFCIVIIIQTFNICHWMKKSPGEAGFGLAEIFMYIPIFLLFAIYAIIDIRTFCKNKKEFANGFC